MLDGINPSCGDEIQLKLKTDGDIITDGAFVGDGCAISQASTDIMLGMIIGQSKERALEYADIFMRMIRDISHMPARVKCAMLGWRTLSEALKDK